MIRAIVVRTECRAKKIQEIRGLIDPQVHVLQGFCFYGFYTTMMSC